MKLQLAKF